MKISQKTKNNLGALGLSIYIYILICILFMFLAVSFGGGDSITLFRGIIRIFYVSMTAWMYIYIPIQFILFLLAKWILKKTSKKKVLMFIYITLGIFAVLLLFLKLVPLPGWQ